MLPLCVEVVHGLTQQVGLVGVGQAGTGVLHLLGVVTVQLLRASASNSTWQQTHHGTALIWDKSQDTLAGRWQGATPALEVLHMLQVCWLLRHAALGASDGESASPQQGRAAQRSRS